MKIEPLVPRGCEFVRDGKVLAEVFDPYLAQLLEHAPEMLAVCKMVIEAEYTHSDELSYAMMENALEAAEKVIKKVEGVENVHRTRR